MIEINFGTTIVSQNSQIYQLACAPISSLVKRNLDVMHSVCGTYSFGVTHKMAQTHPIAWLNFAQLDGYI